MKKKIVFLFLSVILIQYIFSAGQEDNMSKEKRNLKTIELIVEMYNNEPELAYKIFDPNCIHHVNGTIEAGRGPEVIKNSLAMMGKQFSGSKTTFNEIIADGDSIAVRWTWEAVNIQTNKKWTFNGNTIFNLRKGKIIEYWAIDDRLREMMTHGFTLTPPQK